MWFGVTVQKTALSRATETLDAAKRSLAAGDTQAAVSALVLAWAKLPSTRIAALAIRLSATLPRLEMPAKVTEREWRWLELAANPSPETVHTLLAVDWPAHPRGVKARLDRYEKFPPDPRIAAAFRDLWHSGAYRSEAGGVFWRRAFRMLLNWKDPGTAAIIALAKRDETYGVLQSVVDRRTKTPLPTEPELTEEDARLITEIEALSGDVATEKKNKQQLLEAVYAHPEDDGPRLVLADLLVSEGDPRGEFIQLQNALDQGRGAKGKLGKRVASLLRAYGRKWLDGLDAMVSHDAVFHCGFASDVTLERDLDPNVRAWRTVTTLRFGLNPPRAQALLHENLEHVSRLVEVPMSTFSRLIESCGPRRFDLVEARGDLETVTACEAQVKHLSVRGGPTPRFDGARRFAFADVFGWFERSALRDHVEVLELDGVESALGEALQGMARNPSLRELRLRPFSGVYFRGDTTAVFWDVRIARDAAGSPSILDATWTGASTNVGPQGTADGLTRALESLADDALTIVSVRNARPVHAALQETRDAALVAAVRRQRRLETLTSSGRPLSR